MPTWIQQQKENSQPNIFTLNQRIINVNSSNENQMLAYNLVFTHYSQSIDEQLLLIATGLAGSGKRYVIDTVRNVLQDKCKVLAYFGVAAFNVQGQTLNSLLQLPQRGNRSGDLKGLALNRFQEELSNISYIIIDEYSVIGQQLFGWIDRCCRQATGMTSVPFGRICYPSC